MERNRHSFFASSEPTNACSHSWVCLRDKREKRFAGLGMKRIALLIVLGLLLFGAVPSASTQTVFCTSGASSITLDTSPVTTWSPPGCSHR
jgi:hypothetical protein